MPVGGSVEAWVELTEVSLPLVSFLWTFVFDGGAVLTSNSTLGFRTEAEIRA
ncbi:methyltransferase, partial [mine drainage metagenome]